MNKTKTQAVVVIVKMNSVIQSKFSAILVPSFLILKRMIPSVKRADVATSVEIIKVNSTLNESHNN